jgi:2-polyprenyl-6-methoxyphenol hydroxylase-like FAD-dependent oxidoreductase
MNTPPTALIVGGGIGGMATALALHRIGWTATILERRPHTTEPGAGLSLSPNALRALDTLGVGHRARTTGHPFHGPFDLRTPSGRHLVQAPPGTPTPLLGFHRADLHTLLREAVPSTWIRPATTVTAVHTHHDTATIDADGTRLSADLVIGADGAHSTTRRTLWPHAPTPRHTGATVWRAIADLPLERGHMVLGRGTYTLAMPVAGHRVYWALGTRADRPGIRYHDDHSELARRLTHYPADIRALLDATPAHRVLHHDIDVLDPLPTYTRGRVALLGDAAHLMCPDLAQGAATAIEDAVVLAHALAHEPTTDAALTRYDTERRPRTQWIAASARAKQRDNLTLNPLHRALTTTTLALVPSTRWTTLAERSLNTLWGWEPPRPLQPHHT